MSYILEAIKKADRKRKIGEVPDLHTNHNMSGEEPVKRALWPYLLALLLFFNAGVILWWLEPWKEPVAEKVEVIEAPVEETAVVVSSSQVAAGEKEGAELKTGGPGEGKNDEKLEAVSANQVKPAENVSDMEMEKAEVLPLSTGVVQEEKPVDVSKISDTGQVLAKQNRAESEEVEEGAGTSGTEGDSASSDKLLDASEEILGEGEDDFEDPLANMSETDGLDDAETSDNTTEKEITFEVFDINKVPFIYQLPASVRQQLPEIDISFHSYTHRPATRMVRLNGRIMREGQDVTEDIKLERIVPTGVMLVFEKRRFRVDI